MILTSSSSGIGDGSKRGEVPILLQGYSYLGGMILLRKKPSDLLRAVYMSLCAWRNAGRQAMKVIYGVVNVT